MNAQYVKNVFTKHIHNWNLHTQNYNTMTQKRHCHSNLTNPNPILLVNIFINLFLCKCHTNIVDLSFF